MNKEKSIIFLISSGMFYCKSKLNMYVRVHLKICHYHAWFSSYDRSKIDHNASQFYEKIGATLNNLDF